MEEENFEKRQLFLIIIVFISFAFTYAFFVPFNAAPDEAAHFDYIDFIVENRKLPSPSLINDGVMEIDLATTALPRDKKFYYEVHQPPLYYLINAPLLFLGKKISLSNSYLFPRLFSALLGALTLFVVYKIACLVFPHNLYLKLAAPLAVFFVPMFVYMSAMINNDALANLMGALLIFYCLKVIRMSPNELNKNLYFTGGIILSLSFLTKTVIYPLILLLLFLLFLKSIKNLGNIKWLIILTIAPLLAVSELWFLRNYLIQKNIFGWADLLTLQQFHSPLTLNIVTLDMWLDQLFDSFWGDFLNWQDVYLPQATGLMLRGLVTLVFVIIISYLVSQWQKIPKFQKQALFVFIYVLASICLGLVIFNLKFYQPQGRYFFPAISVFALGLAYTWHKLTPSRLKRGSLVSFFLLAVLLNLIALIRIAMVL